MVRAMIPVTNPTLIGILPLILLYIIVASRFGGESLALARSSSNSFLKPCRADTVQRPSEAKLDVIQRVPGF